MTDLIPGAVYVVRGDSTWLGHYPQIVAQALARGPRHARAGHAFIAVAPDELIELTPDEPDRPTTAIVAAHPDETGDWWRAIVPPVTDRLDIVAAAWALDRAIDDGTAELRYTYRAALASGFPARFRVNEFSCSTYAAHVAAVAGVDLIPGCPWYAVTPADIARAATIGSDI